MSRTQFPCLAGRINQIAASGRCQPPLLQPSYDDGKHSHEHSGLPGLDTSSGQKAIGRLCLVLFELPAHWSPGKQFRTTNSLVNHVMPL
ncbi:hypothetical protein GPALN_006562 [Globodera pallida]|nr:hypothetical protein GPALN_006562 [Globodera pallida]